MIKVLYLWYVRNFKVITIKKANELGLKWYCNIYGDEINKLNCRSIFIDKKGRNYRVKELK
jgi:hypothetical protein